MSLCERCVLSLSARDGAHVENRIASEYSLAEDIAYVIRGVPRKVYDTAAQLAESKLLLVLEILVERMFKECFVVETIHRCKPLLDLCDASTNADQYVTAETALQVLRCSKVICMSVRLTETCVSTEMSHWWARIRTGSVRP